MLLEPYKTTDFCVGTVFIGNVNKEEMEIVKIENNTYATFKNLETGKLSYTNLQTLTKCDLTILRNKRLQKGIEW